MLFGNTLNSIPTSVRKNKKFYILVGIIETNVRKKLHLSTNKTTMKQGRPSTPAVDI